VPPHEKQSSADRRTGVGKTAIVRRPGAAYRRREVPSSSPTTYSALDLSLIVGRHQVSRTVEERLKTIMKELMESQNSIIFIDELHTLVAAGIGGRTRWTPPIILKPALVAREIQCIGATTPLNTASRLKKTGRWNGLPGGKKFLPPEQVTPYKIPLPA